MGEDVGVVAIGIAQRDGKYPLLEELGDLVSDLVRITTVAMERGKDGGSLGRRRRHSAAPNINQPSRRSEKINSERDNPEYVP